MFRSGDAGRKLAGREVGEGEWLQGEEDDEVEEMEEENEREDDDRADEEEPGIIETVSSGVPQEGEQM